MYLALPRLILYSALQVIAVTAVWFLAVTEWRWDVIQQFIGHLGPGAFLVAMGVAALFYRDDPRKLAHREALLAMLAGGLYVVGDTFLMHPPWGVFSGPGQAEQEHVSIMGLIFVMGLSSLVARRKFATRIPTSAHFLIVVAVVALVFGTHPQHTAAGALGHYATMLFLGVAALFRILEKHTEYAMAIIVSGFVFFSSQTGLAEYVDAAGNSPGAWVALWSMLGLVSATGYLALAPGETMAAEQGPSLDG